MDLIAVNQKEVGSITKLKYANICIMYVESNNIELSCDTHPEV